MSICFHFLFWSKNIWNLQNVLNSRMSNWPKSVGMELNESKMGTCQWIEKWKEKKNVNLTDWTQREIFHANPKWIVFMRYLFIIQNSIPEYPTNISAATCSTRISFIMCTFFYFNSRTDALTEIINEIQVKAINENFGWSLAVVQLNKAKLLSISFEIFRICLFLFLSINE